MGTCIDARNHATVCKAPILETSSARSGVCLFGWQLADYRSARSECWTELVAHMVWSVQT